MIARDGGAPGGQPGLGGVDRGDQGGERPAAVAAACAGRVEAAAQAMDVVQAQRGDPLAQGWYVDLDTSTWTEGAAPPAGSTAAPPGAALSGVAPPGEATSPAAGTPDAAWLGVF